MTFIKWAWRGFLNKILRRKKVFYFCSFLCENANMLLCKHENEVIIRRPSFISIVRAKPLRVEITQLEKFTKLRWFILKFFCRIFYIFNYDLYTWIGIWRWTKIEDETLIKFGHHFPYFSVHALNKLANKTYMEFNVILKGLKSWMFRDEKKERLFLFSNQRKYIFRLVLCHALF